MEHRNEDGMSRATRDCKFLDCEVCNYWHRCNDRCRGSDSVDSDTEMAAFRCDRLRVTLAKIAKKPDDQQSQNSDDMEEERPDKQDYHMWDLELARLEAHDDVWLITTERSDLTAEEKEMRGLQCHYDFRPRKSDRA